MKITMIVLVLSCSDYDVCHEVVTSQMERDSTSSYIVGFENENNNEEENKKDLEGFENF